MNKTKLLDACVQLVTVNGRPLSILKDSGMRQISDPVYKSISLIDSTFTINRRNLLEEIHSEADRIRNQIKEDIKNHLIRIKADMTTRFNRSFIGGRFFNFVASLN